MIRGFDWSNSHGTAMFGRFAHRSGRSPSISLHTNRKTQREEFSMKAPSWSTRFACALLMIAVASKGVALAQEEEKETGWKDTAELGFVSTSGNSESSTIGFKNLLTREWTKAQFTFRLGGTQVETTNTIFFVEGTPPDFDNIHEEKITNTTTEMYYANLRYSRDITKRFFWYVGANWDRNIPAGIENRYIGDAGVGNIWYDKDKIKWRTTYGLSYTDQQDVIEIPGEDSQFAGARLVSAFDYQITESVKFANLFIGDLNFDNSDAWRIDMVNSLIVAMSEKLALGVSHQLLYNNDPALIARDVVNRTDNSITAVPIQADTTDAIFTVSLVVNF